MADSPRHALARVRCRAAEDDNDNDDVEIELAPGGTVTGRVVFQDGKPAAFIRVRCQGTKHSGWATAGTDAKGRFVLRSLCEDGYNIWASKKGFTVKAHDSFVVEGGKIHAAGDLVLVRGGFITGRVVDARGRRVRPEGRLAVGLYGPSRPRSGAAIESVRVGKDGTFRIRAAPGRNYIYFCSGGAQGGIYVNVVEGRTTEVEMVR